MALLARAALDRLAGDAPGAAPDPLAVAADFLRAPDPGPVELHTELLRAGRTASVVAVRLWQDGRLMLTATVTAGRLPAATAGVHAAVRSWPREPAADALDPAEVDPISGVARCCDLRWEPATVPFTASGAGPAGGPRLGPPARRADRRAVRAAGRGHPAADRVQPGRGPRLGADRAAHRAAAGPPGPGWLRLESRATTVAGGWFDEDARRAGLDRPADLPGPAAGLGPPATVTSMTRIAVLGAGKIGEALLSGLLAAGASAGELVFTERHPERAAELTDRLGVAAVGVAEAAAHAELIVVAVKPQDIAPVLGELAPVLRPGTLVVSLCAGLPTALFEGALPDGHAGGAGHAEHPDAGRRGDERDLRGPPRRRRPAGRGGEDAGLGRPGGPGARGASRTRSPRSPGPARPTSSSWSRR